MTPGRYRIRLSREDDLPKLPDIEIAADATYFAALGTPDPRMHPIALSVLRPCHGAGTVWVAADRDDEPVGFIAATELDGALYLIEMDVLPQHHRRGLGRALMEAAVSHARWALYPAVVLTTDRLIPFNAPFYRRLGFVELRPTELSPGLQGVLEREAGAGFDPARRIAMAKVL